jgi:protein tyrosine phosphatase
MHIKRANIEHSIYPIRDHFIPKSISDYMQFLYTIIINIQRFNHNRLLVHCMNGTGRTGMTIVCIELLYNYIMNENEQEKKQKFIERFCHYPFLFQNSCRVCQSISNLRKIRPKILSNPLQIFFIHEFYARLKCPSYMKQIKDIIKYF